MNLVKLTLFRGSATIMLNPATIVSMQECISQKEYETEPTYYTEVKCVNGETYQVLGRLEDVANIIAYP